MVPPGEASPEGLETFGGTIRLPADSQKSVGTMVEVTASDWSLPGYGQVAITLDSVTAVSADQRWEVRFDSSVDDPLPRGRGCVVRVPVVLPQDQSSVRTVVMVPCYALCDSIVVSAMRDGRAIDGYRDRLRTNFNDIDEVDDVLTRYLATQVSADVAAMSADAGESLSGGSLSGSSLLGGGEVAAARLPDVLSVQSVDQLARRPEGLGRVREQLLGGGLVVLGVAAEREAIERSLGMPLWRTAGDERAEALRTAGESVGAVEFWRAGAGRLMMPVDPEVDTTSVDTTSVGTTPVEGASVEAVAKLVAEYSPRAASNLVARGVDPMMGDSRFSQWLVPGVAQPPVYTFMGIMTVFVLLIGPVAYRWTTRRGRGYLMFVIAPVLAVVTTGSMFAYGIVSDGFGTIVRVRQITVVDGAGGEVVGERGGDAGERSRVTYFSGLRPGGGINFPIGARVFPYPRVQGGRGWEVLAEEPPESLGTITIAGGVQNFEAAFLPSRQQRQFVVESTRRGVGGLVVRKRAVAAEDGSKVGPVVANRFGFDLRRLVCRDDDGEYWVAEEIAAGAERRLQLPGRTPASIRLGDLYNDFRPIGEVGQSRGGVRSIGTTDLINVVNASFAETPIEVEGRFESLLLTLLKTEGQLPERFFVAISDPSPELVGVEAAEVVDSVRYVLGPMTVKPMTVGTSR